MGCYVDMGGFEDDTGKQQCSSENRAELYNHREEKPGEKGNNKGNKAGCCLKLNSNSSRNNVAGIARKADLSPIRERRAGVRGEVLGVYLILMKRFLQRDCITITTSRDKIKTDELYTKMCRCVCFWVFP